MDIHPIRTERDHARALKRLEKLWGARAGTARIAIDVRVSARLGFGRALSLVSYRPPR
jgi:hypothetical protein